MMQFKNLKGSYDYLPEKQILREKIKGILSSTFHKYGFSPIETPILCYYDLLSSKYSEGADILNETYKLTDQGERSLGLRYDLTITFAKLISSNADIKLPFKRYEMGKVFRDGPVKLGRNREFTQCDIDTVGVKSLLAEATYFSMCKEVFSKLELDVVIKYNNRKLLLGLIEYVGIPSNLANEVIIIVDKLEKLSRKELLSEFYNLGISEDIYIKMEELFQMDLKDLILYFTKQEMNENIKTGMKELNELEDYITAMELKDLIKFCPFLARGIGVYTGTVWEVFMKDESITSSISAGGRYDNIITNFIDNGSEYPAVGMTFGLDVIYEALRIKSDNLKKTVVELFLIPMGTEVQTLKLANILRNYGINTDIDMTGQKIKKAFSYADKIGIPYASAIGENEVNSKSITIKSLLTGEQNTFAYDNYIDIAKFINPSTSLNSYIL